MQVALGEHSFSCMHSLISLQDFPSPKKPDGHSQVYEPFMFEHVAIVDDVVTSGHTVNAFSKVLRQAGVKEIDVWCVGRA